MATRMLAPTDVLQGHPKTEDDYRRTALATAAKKGKAVKISALPLHAYIVAGWWVADCPNCGAGIAVNPEWSFAACFGLGCHTVYSTIVIPGRWQDIEAALVDRPIKMQHWLCAPKRTAYQGLGRVQMPDETVEELQEQTEVILGRREGTPIGEEIPGEGIR